MPWDRSLLREKARLVRHPRAAELIFSRLYPTPADQGEASTSPDHPLQPRSSLLPDTIVPRLRTTTPPRSGHPQPSPL